MTMFFQLLVIFSVLALAVIAPIIAVRLSRIHKEHGTLQGKFTELQNKLKMLDEANSRLRGESSYLKAYLEGREAATVTPDPNGEQKAGIPVSFENVLGRLGFTFEEVEDSWEYETLPESIRLSFATREDRDRTIAVCSSCMDSGLAVVCSEDRNLHPGGSLGIFCTDCGRGRLFSEVNKVRRAANLPELPDGQLMQAMFVLQEEAKRLGIRYKQKTSVPPPDPEPAPSPVP
jgi:hypothetical protein